MIKRVTLGVLAAWAAIVALAWWLANERLNRCPYIPDCNDFAALETRDNVLVWGAVIPLFVFVAVCVLGLVRLRRKSSSGLATPELRSRHPY